MTISQTARHIARTLLDKYAVPFSVGTPSQQRDLAERAGKELADALAKLIVELNTEP